MLLSAIAFGVPVDMTKVHIEGITHLEAKDIKFAEELGYRIKLLGITKYTDYGIELRVHPALVPTRRLLANVEGAMNAVVVKGDAAESSLYYGKGAGSEPTGSAVVADLIDIARTAEVAVSERPRMPTTTHNPKAKSLLTSAIRSALTTCAFPLKTNPAFWRKSPVFWPTTRFLLSL